MHKIFNNIFAGKQDQKECIYKGSFDSANNWLNGTLYDGSNSYDVVNGVPVFVAEESQTWPPDASELEAVTIEWIDRKVKNYGHDFDDDVSFNKCQNEIHELIANIDGKILEIAHGPDGGNIIGVINKNPNAKILANELGYNISRIWNQYSLDKSFGQYLSFSCFNALNMPIKNNSFDCVSSYCALTEIREKSDLVKEINRVLKENGLLVSFELLSELKYSDKTPRDYVEKFDYVKPDFYKILGDGGFKIERYEKVFSFKLHGAEISIEAENNNAEIYSDLYVITARKI